MNDEEYWFNLTEGSDSAVTVEFPSLSRELAVGALSPAVNHIGFKLG